MSERQDLPRRNDGDTSALFTEDFALANRAFDLFTLSERFRALRVFAGLRYPSPTDRFVEAVHRVIVEG
jgi:hypothetical protein